MSTAPETAVEQLTAVVARRVRGLRAEHGLTQAELGRALGMSTASVSERLRGDTRFDINELPALAQALNTSIEYLLGLTEVRVAGGVSTLTDRERSTQTWGAKVDDGAVGGVVVDLGAYRSGKRAGRFFSGPRGRALA